MSDGPITYKDVFVPGGFPRHTYNPRATLELERKVKSVLENLFKLVVVTGHTKSGKTVLVSKILPRTEAVWIDGGGVTTEDDFWNVVIDQLQLSQTTSNEQVDSVSGGIMGETAVGGSLVVAKASTKLGANFEGSASNLRSQTRSLSSRTAALSGLRSLKRPLVMDDFHYLPKSIQGSIIRALKPLIFEGIPVVVIAIPHKRYDAIKVEKEMTGRILSVSVPTWSKDELKYIPSTGFALLREEIPETVSDSLATESMGSPHLMQEFCREMCNMGFAGSGVARSIDEAELRATFEQATETIGRPIFDKLKRGPRQRSDRRSRTLKSGHEVDIYGLVLEALAHIKPGLTTLEYEEVRTAIKEVCVTDDIPNVQQVTSVLKQMAKISATDESSTPVIDFDEADRLLHITDPFFAFYLRWGKIFD